MSPRESDLNVAADLFVGSSTVYGTNSHGNRSYSSKTGWRENHNDVTQQQIDCMAHDQIEFAHNDASVRFMSYNPYYTHGGNPEVLDRAICLNDFSVLSLLADKRSFRRFAKRHVSVPEFSIIRRADCTPQKLAELFPQGTVIQRGISSGGEGTFVVPAGHELPPMLDDPNEELLVSRHYAQNVPINIHAVIYEKDIVLFPASTQLIESRDGKLLYCGCDYVSFGDLSAGIRHELACQARRLCAQIQKTGYRGVLGLDAMVADGKVLILEMNARFQASSHALNHALMRAGLPRLQELHREAFLRAKPSVDEERFFSLEVPFSTCAYSSFGTHELDAPFEHLYRAAQADKGVAVFDDGLDPNQPRKPGAYLFGILVNGRVSSIFFDRHLNVDQNVSCWGGSAPTEPPADDSSWIKLKIALLNQGCTVSARAKTAMLTAGGVREGVNDAIDLELLGHVVNVPIAMPHQGFSPFLLDVDKDGQLELLSYNTHLARVSVSYRDQVQDKLTPSGVPVDRICFLATDRVRVQHHDCCDVIERGQRCKFCNFPAGKAGFDLTDIDYAVAAYLDSGIPFRHFLIGGGSDLGADALIHTLAVVESIRSRSDKPIYLMDMPPMKSDSLRHLKEAGVTEVAFNIEVFDRAIAREVMPLKGAIPLERYLAALEAAVDLWGNTGAVRSALVVGIEPLSSTLQGVEELASRGVAPILSVFRPVAQSPMADSIGPDNTWLLELYQQASAICASYGLHLGPQCEACRNNVLAP
ncbi:MAG: ATP-grasp domain-containing protein [Atopobiaceae bacterium]|nr:ATP-grasp domain-containing protein [Atopobiaceae bacterium]